jgi:hypothetical protein
LSLSSPSVWMLSIIDCNGRLFLRQNLLQRYCGITSTMSVRQICINANTHKHISPTDLLKLPCQITTCWRKITQHRCFKATWFLQLM